MLMFDSPFVVVLGSIRRQECPALESGTNGKPVRSATPACLTLAGSPFSSWC